jgi:hypothetical protein
MDPIAFVRDLEAWKTERDALIAQIGRRLDQLETKR